MINRSKESICRILNAIPSDGCKYVNEKCYKICDTGERLKIIEISILINVDDTIFDTYANCKDRYKLLNYIDFHLMSFLGRKYYVNCEVGDTETDCIAEAIAHSLLRDGVSY